MEQGFRLKALGTRYQVLGTRCLALFFLFPLLYSPSMATIPPSLDEEYRNQGYTLIAGVDEAGRGPLAGPVCAAAVILPWDCTLPSNLDSKSHSPASREVLSDLILSMAVSWKVATVDNPDIDRINILQASLKAMAMAVENLSPPPEIILVDGNRSPFMDLPSRAVAGGDRISRCIGAASILAKTHRDQLMVQYHGMWPQYGFDRHKGYPTREHLEAIVLHGPCPIHRKTFRGVREHVRENDKTTER